MLTKENKPDFKFVFEKYMEMCESGIKISLDIAEKLGEELNNEILSCKERMISQLPEKYGKLNFNSSKQIAEVMREVFDVEQYCGKTNKGAPSYKQEDLERIYEKTGIPFMRDFAEYKSTNSILKKLQEIVGAADSNNNIHPSFSFASTNRISYSNPGISNCNARIRSIISAPDGYKLVKCDYKAQEVYILANMLNIKVLKDIFKKYDDFYTGVVKEALGVDLKPEYRDNMKTAWLAGVYGSKLNNIMYIDKEENDLAHALKEFANKIPEIVTFREYVMKNYVKGGSPIESYFGSTRELDAYVWNMREDKIFNIAFNNVFQITGADMLFFAIEEFYNRNIDDNDIRPYFSIHDELIFAVKEELVNDDTLNLLKDIMQLKIEGWDLIKVKMTVADSY